MLISARKKNGLGQQALANRLGKSQTWVSRIERGARRVDVIEFVMLARALKFDPARAIKALNE